MPIKSKSAENVARVLIDLFFRFGPPNKIITDQGREFVNAVNENLFATVNVKHLISSAYHPQTNGQDERTNRTLKTALGKLVNKEKTNWDELINPILFAIRTSKQESIKCTPYMAMFGRPPKLFCEIAMGNAESAESEAVLNELKGNDVNDLIQRFNRLNESIKTNIKNAQAKQEKAYEKRKNKGYKTYKLNAGDNVLKKKT